MEWQAEPTLVELIRYNTWANQQVLAACQGLSEEQLATAMPGAYGSIRDTLGHLLRAEANYVGRMTGARPQPAFRWEDKPSVAEMSAFAEQTGAAFLDTVQRLPPTHNVHEEENGQTIDYHARLLFMQVILHGVEHRTNVTTTLSSLGLPTPEVDGWGYMFAHPARFDLVETGQEGGG